MARTKVPADSTLTPAQFRVLRALWRLMKTNPAPSLAELAAVSGEDGGPITTTSITQHVGHLKLKGMLTNTPGRTRSIRITPDGLSELGEE
jgi:DNA-binding MarR family transcriptional regulator